MPIQYQQTMDTEIQDRVRRRRWAAIQELELLHFQEHSFFGETVQALGFSNMGLAGFLGTLVALFFEVIKVDKNLDVTAFNVVMASRQDATYAAPFGLGVKFYTSFTDGTCVISANFDTSIINDEKGKLYKSAAQQTIASAWLQHKTWVDQLCQEGKQRVEHLSFAGFLQLTQREDAYLLKHKNHLLAGDIVSTMLSLLISISLFAAAAFMFWFWPRMVHGIYPGCWFVRNVNFPSLLLIPVLIFACLAISWFLALTQEKPLTVDGVGTKFFGQTPSSNGYISTKWLVVVFLPIIPVRSYLVTEEFPGGPHNTHFSMKPLEELNWVQIKETIWKAKFGYLLFMLLIVGFAVWAFRECM